MIKVVEKESDDCYTGIHEVYVNGELYFTWNDESNVYAPEDLTWGREISKVFFAGVEAGKLDSPG